MGKSGKDSQYFFNMDYAAVNARTINFIPFKFRPDIIGSWKIVNFQTGLTVVISFQYKPVIDISLR